MKTDLAFIAYFTESEIKKEFGSYFKDVKDSPYDVLEAILGAIASQEKVSDFVFNYYTEGKIFKKLKNSGSVAYFTVKNISQYYRLESLVTFDNINEIMHSFMECAVIGKAPDEYSKPSIENLEENIKNFMRKFFLERNLEKKKEIKSVKI